MNPHKEGLDLHLAKAIKRAKEEKDVATGTTTVPLQNLVSISLI